MLVAATRSARVCFRFISDVDCLAFPKRHGIWSHLVIPMIQILIRHHYRYGIPSHEMGAIVYNLIVPGRHGASSTKATYDNAPR